MRPFRYLRRRPDVVASEIDEELLGHMARRAEALQAEGLSADRARAVAEREFGDFEAARRYCRGQAEEKERRVQRGLMFRDLAQDVRITLRSLVRSPLLAVTIVLTVGLGIGATTAIVAVLDAAILRPLPYVQPDQLVRIYTDAPPYKFRFSVVDYQALESQQTTFSKVAAYTDRTMTFTDGATAERIPVRLVSWTYFDLLGLKPARGRDFTVQDNRAGAASTAIVSHRFWEQRLGSRPDAIGRAVRLDGTEVTVVGVLPLDTGPLERGQEVFLAANWGTPQRKGPFFLLVLGRVPPASAQAAAAELHAITKRLFPVWKSSYQDARATWSMMDLKEAVIGNFRSLATLAIIAVGLVWLIACVNASNLLVARVTSRRRELAIRTALGASRQRVVRYLLAESALLALAAAALGAVVAWSLIGLARDLGVNFVPRTTEIHFDGRAVWTLAAITVGSVLLFGLVPAVHGTGGPVDEGLRSLGRTSTAGTGMRRLRALLVGSQFAVATPLLIIAGLLLASLNHLRHVDLGFDSHNVLTGQIQLPQAQYRDGGPIAAFWNELQRRTEALPGVIAVAYTNSRPPDDSNDHNNFDLESSPTPPGQSQPVTAWVGVTPGYFRLFALKLVEGRLLTNDDAGDGPPVIVVDRAWAARFFPGRSAVGQRMKNGGCTLCPWTTIVGVVSDVRYDGLSTDDPGVVYWPLPARGESAAQSMVRYLVIRTALDPSSLVPSVRQAVQGLDPSLALGRVSTVDEMVARSLEVPRTLSLVIGTLSLVALVLSVVGIYGVMAHYVQQHAKDISIRLALGGRPGAVLRLIVQRGMTLVVAGVIVGAAVAAALARPMTTLLFGVTPADPATFAAVVTFMLVIAALACWIPGLRAVGAAPAAILRGE
jgi:predicted permease